MTTYFLDDGAGFSEVLIDDCGFVAGLRAVLLLGVVIGEAELVGIAVRFVVEFLLHVGTVALERSSKLLDDLLHLAADTLALLAGLSHHPLRVFLLLRGKDHTLAGSLQMLLRMTSPW
jgi:hypothetical protein